MTPVKVNTDGVELSVDVEIEDSNILNFLEKTSYNLEVSL